MKQTNFSLCSTTWQCSARFFYSILPCRRGVWGTKSCRPQTPGVYFCFLASNSASKSVRLGFSTHVKMLPVVKLFFAHLAL